MTLQTTPGKIEISNEVIGTIAGVALSDVPGIAGMKGSFFSDIRRAATGKKDFAAGVEVDPGQDGKEFALDLFIIVEYDVKINDVAARAQAAVKEKVESITGRIVSAINVHIVDIRLPESLREVHRED